MEEPSLPNSAQADIFAYSKIEDGMAFLAMGLGVREIFEIRFIELGRACMGYFSENIRFVW